jgi:nicotinate-nucleotide pyrophosphorylase (carboxylating)
VPREHEQIVWDKQLEDDLRHLVRLAVREDLGRLQDWTTVSLVPAEARGRATAVTRADGVVAGMLVGQVVLDEMETDVRWHPNCTDGDSVTAGTTLAMIEGSARDLLTAERTILNIMGRLSGISTLTRRYVDAIAGTRARICDTRKTTPAWRRLEKFAVRCGGGLNHRTGLFDAVLIKDNHLAFYGHQTPTPTPADAVMQARRFVCACDAIVNKSDFIIEIEVDSLDQLRNALSANPDIVLLDNMDADQMRSAVAVRDELAPDCELEASGGVTLQTVASIAATGVERISVGALTHSATSLDVGLDWSDD